MPPATPTGTASSTAGASSPATSTRRPSPTRTTSPPSRTAGTTHRRARTPTSARGPTRRTSRSRATSSRSSPPGATRHSTRPATAAPSRGSRRKDQNDVNEDNAHHNSRRCGDGARRRVCGRDGEPELGHDHVAEDRLDARSALESLHRGGGRRDLLGGDAADDTLLPPA